MIGVLFYLSNFFFFKSWKLAIEESKVVEGVNQGRSEVEPERWEVFRRGAAFQLNRSACLKEAWALWEGRARLSGALASGNGCS